MRGAGPSKKTGLAPAHVCGSKYASRKIRIQKRGAAFVFAAATAERIKANSPWLRPECVGAIYYADHLNTPRVITNQAAQVVWRWDHAEPFGSNPPNENPSGLGTFTCNLRLPGQYFDKETNLHYNHFRDYDPAIGRYIQSDPIGLEAGPNTYAYVESNPIDDIDPEGLSSLSLCANPANAAACAAAGIGAASGAATSLVANVAVQVAQGGGSFECVDWGQALASAASGAILGAVTGVGASSLQTYKNIRALKRLAAARGLTYKPPANPSPFSYAQTYVGSGQKLIIKTQPAINAPGSLSQVPRFSWQVGGSSRNPIYWNPFTGQVGPGVQLAHIPLNPGLSTPALIGLGATTGIPMGVLTNWLYNQ